MPDMNSIPIFIKGECSHCGYIHSEIRWLPFRNWKKYIGNQVLKCFSCGKSIKGSLEFEIVEPKFYIRNNFLYVKVANQSKEIFNLNSGDIDIYLDGFPKGWKGKINFYIHGSSIPFNISLDRGKIRLNYDNKLFKQLTGEKID